MSRIEQLTPQQISKFPSYVSEWLGFGLNSSPINWENAKGAICLAYGSAGLDHPRIFIKLRSPLEGAVGAFLLTKLPRNLSGAQVWDQVGDQVGAQVWDQVGDQVRAQVGAQVWDQVGDQVWAQVWAQVWDQVRDQVGDQVRAQVYKCGYGSHDSSWIAFYEFFGRECGLTSTEKLFGLAAATRECGWWWPFTNAVIITERPVTRWNGRRLHNPTGMAVEYPDGFGVYAWNGRRVDRSVIMDAVTVNRIEKESNAETRRILIERFGMAQYVKESGAMRVHSDDFGTLYLKTQPDDETIFMVNVICPTTGREYMLGVDPKAYGGRAGKEAKAAVASTWRDNDSGEMVFATPDEYRWDAHT